MISREEAFEMIRDFEEMNPQRRRYFGVYYGIVEDNLDPLGIARLKVRTPVYFDPQEMPTAALPWANYAAPSGGSPKAGFYFIPPIGSQVVVEYIDGDPTQPIWIGCVWAAPIKPGTTERIPDTYVASIPKPEAGWNYAKFHSLTTPYGHRLEMDDNVPGQPETKVAQSYGKIRLTTPLGNFLNLSEEEEKVELKTRDSRVFRMDDRNRTIVVETPDSPPYRGEFSSAGRFVEFRTSDDHQLVLDDNGDLIDLSTRGTTTQTARGFRLNLDQSNTRATLKGDKNNLFWRLQETAGGNDYIGVQDNYSGSPLTWVRIQRYPSIGSHVIELYAQGSTGRAAIFVGDLGAASGGHQVRLTSITNPESYIKLDCGDGIITRGQITAGRTTGSLASQTYIQITPEIGQLDIRAAKTNAIFGTFTGTGGLPTGATTNRFDFIGNVALTAQPGTGGGGDMTVQFVNCTFLGTVNAITLKNSLSIAQPYAAHTHIITGTGGATQLPCSGPV